MSDGNRWLQPTTRTQHQLVEIHDIRLTSNFGVLLPPLERGKWVAESSLRPKIANFNQKLDLKFTAMACEVISVSYFPLWKRGIEGDLRRLPAEHNSKFAFGQPRLPALEKSQS